MVENDSKANKGQSRACANNKLLLQQQSSSEQINDPVNVSLRDVSNTLKDGGNLTLILLQFTITSAACALPQVPLMLSVNRTALFRCAVLVLVDRVVGALTILHYGTIVGRIAFPVGRFYLTECSVNAKVKPTLQAVSFIVVSTHRRKKILFRHKESIE